MRNGRRGSERLYGAPGGGDERRQPWRTGLAGGNLWSGVILSFWLYPAVERARILHGAGVVRNCQLQGARERGLTEEVLGVGGIDVELANPEVSEEVE